MTQRKVLLLTLLSLATLGVATGGAIWFFSPSLFSCSRHSPKQSPVSLSVGVIDINSIKGNSKVFQKFTANLDTLNAAIYKEIQDQETKLRTEYEHLKKREEEAREPTQEILRLKAELDKKNASLEKIVQERKEELEKRYTKGLTTIKETLKEIVNDLGTIYGLTLILNKSTGDGNQMDQSIVLFCHKGLDLTQEVIQRLDKKLLSKNIQKE